MRLATLLLLALLVSTWAGACDEDITSSTTAPPPPPNEAPRASLIPLPGVILEVGSSLTVLDSETLFWDNDHLTITAESSDPAVIAVAVAPGGPAVNTPYTLTVLAVAPGVAVVTLTATEAERAVPLSATREFKVTVIATGGST